MTKNKNLIDISDRIEHYLNENSNSLIKQTKDNVRLHCH